MADEASARGWVVRVTSQRPGGMPPSVTIYHAGIADPVDAMHAVRTLCEADPDAVIETIAEIPSGTDIRDGEVVQL
jgi:hypothetical protein